MNTLYYGDNLDVLRQHIPDASVDLVYLDPPFNSNANYNVLFSDKGGGKASAQLQAFKDTWSWPEAAPTYQELVLHQGALGAALRAFGQLLPQGGLLAYLVMMAPRLAELHRVLKPTGSLYLHCDPTASHYLKVLMDAIFGPACFRNEIIWKRTTAHNDARRKFADVSDVIFFYSKTDKYQFQIQYGSYSEQYLTSFYRFTDENGRRYRLDNLRSPNPRPNLTYDYKGYRPHANGWAVSLDKMKKLDSEGRLHFPKKQDGRIALKRYLDEMPGTPVTNIWDDINPIGAQAAERMGYATQKPVALLERIIAASSNPGDLVLDPFCGCGTTIAAAQALGRRWVGIDITQAAIRTIRERLSRTLQEGRDYHVSGEPVSVPDAQVLADSDPYQFQWWALGLVGARPAEGKKGSDQGIDGRLYFQDEAEGAMPKQVILSVKAGHTGVAHVRDLRGVIEREGAEIGVLITMQPPTAPMRSEAAGAGLYTSRWGQHPRLQILTIADLLDGKRIDMPPISQVNVTFKKAPRARGKQGRQGELGLG